MHQYALAIGAALSGIILAALLFLGWIFFGTGGVVALAQNEPAIGGGTNVGAGTIFPACIGELPNFVPTSFSMSPSQNITPGQTVTFRGTTRNIGNEPGVSFTGDPWERFCLNNSSCLTNNTGRIGTGHRVMTSGVGLQPGQFGEELVRTWTAVAGDYTLYYCTDTDGSQTNESNENDNCLPAVSFSVGATAPDFEAQNLARNPSNTITAGQQVTFSARVRNIGGTPPRSVWSWFCMDGTQANCLQSNSNVWTSGEEMRPGGGALEGGQYIDFSRPWTAVQGNHTVHICSNTGTPTPAVSEPNRGNNCQSLSFTVEPAQPDLISQNLQRSVGGTINTGANVTFSGNTRNIGSVLAGSHNARFCVGPNNVTLNCYTSTTYALGSDISVPSLNPNTSSSQLTSVAWTPTTAGNYKAELCADPTPPSPDRVDESDETSSSNCVQMSSIQVAAPQPNLVAALHTATPASPRLPDGSYLANSAITFEASSINVTTVPIAGHRARICAFNGSPNASACLDSNTGIIGGDENIGALGANASSPRFSRSWTPTAPGTYTIKVCTDVNPKAITESNENDNCVQTTLTVVPAQPDLIAINLARNPSGSVTVNQPINLTGNIQNTGAAQAGASNARFCVGGSTSACTGGTLTRVPGSSDIPVGVLSVGQSSSQISVQWTPTGTGSFPIHLCADVGNGVTELDENNNCTSLGSVTVQNALPDLQVSSFNAPTGVNVGSPVTFRGAIRNKSTATAGAPASKARFCVRSSPSSSGNNGFNFLNCYSSTTYRVGSSDVDVEPLALPGVTDGDVTSVSWTPTTPGSYRVQLCADPADDVDEITDTENDNCSLVRSFTVGTASVPQADLRSSANTPSGSTSNPVTFTGAVENVSNTAISNSDSGEVFFEIDLYPTGNSGPEDSIVSPDEGADMPAMSGQADRDISYVFPGTVPANAANTSHRFRVVLQNTVNENPAGNTSGWRTFTIGGVTSGPPDISANPTVVDRGATSNVSWDPNGHVGCVITSTNVDNGIEGAADASGSETTVQLFGQTTYRIDCPDDGSFDEVTIRTRGVIIEE